MAQEDYSVGYQVGLSRSRQDFKKFIPKRNEIPQEYLGKSREFQMGFMNGYQTGYEKSIRVAQDLARINGHI